jgi:hypothetical protein
LLELAHSSASLYLFWSHILCRYRTAKLYDWTWNGHCVQHNDLGLLSLARQTYDVSF